MSRVSEEILKRVVEEGGWATEATTQAMARELRAARVFIHSARKSKLMNERTKEALAAYDALEDGE